MTKIVHTDTDCTRLTTSKIELCDLKEIIAIAQICFSDPWSNEMFVEEIKSTDSVCIKNKLNSKTVAYIIARYFTDELHIMHLAVLPEFRGQGIGKCLVKLLMRDYKAKKYLLEVRTTNTGAIKLYSGVGFKIIGKRKNYYSNGDDAIVMVRETEK